MGAAEDLKHIYKNAIPETVFLIERKPKTACFLAIVFVLWTFCGWVYNADFEDEGYVDFFVKTNPTPFHSRFLDSYNSDTYEEWVTRSLQDKNGHWLLKTKEFEEYALYCWHRYGIAHTEKSENVEDCRKRSRSHGQW